MGRMNTLNARATRYIRVILSFLPSLIKIPPDPDVGQRPAAKRRPQNFTLK
jgi:hypothetical protein